MVKGKLTGAHYGLSSWLQQRITAIIMLVCTLFFIYFVVDMAYSVDSSFMSWQNAVHSIFIKIFIEVFVLALLLHAWVGVRDIIMDYVHCAGIRLTLYILTILWLIGSLMYSVKVIF